MTGLREAWREELATVMLAHTAGVALDAQAAPVTEVTFGQLADAIINKYDLAEGRHLVRFAEDGWKIQHPVAERLVGLLLDCAVHLDYAHFLVEPPESGLGDYWLSADGLEAVASA